LTLTNLSHKSEELSRKCFALANQFYIWKCSSKPFHLNSVSKIS
jgi:hypothetical protein